MSVWDSGIASGNTGNATHVLLGRKLEGLYHRYRRGTTFHYEAFAFCNYSYILPTQSIK